MFRCMFCRDWIREQVKQGKRIERAEADAQAARTELDRQAEQAAAAAALELVLAEEARSAKNLEDEVSLEGNGKL